MFPLQHPKKTRPSVRVLAQLQSICIAVRTCSEFSPSKFRDMGTRAVDKMETIIIQQEFYGQLSVVAQSCNPCSWKGRKELKSRPDYDIGLEASVGYMTS